MSLPFWISEKVFLILKIDSGSLHESPRIKFLNFSSAHGDYFDEIA